MKATNLLTEHPLWRLSFRPFFLFGAVYAVIAMVIWVAFLSGLLAPVSSWDPVIWHSHEMVFGFYCAIVSGFVLTAIQNWSGRPGTKGLPLVFAFSLWVLGRIFIAFPSVSPLIAATLDLAFLPLVAFLLAPDLRDPELRTERVFLLFLGLLSFGNLLVHLEMLGVDPFHFREGTARIGIRLGLDTILMVTLFMGGRVIPFFTESSVARAQPRTFAWVEVLAPISAFLFLIADLFARGTRYLAVSAAFACVIHAVRVGGWQVRRSRRVPLIWVLHLGYSWLVVGFALSAMSAFGWVPVTSATHAFTVGGLGIMVYGMISRVSLGHTGRRLHPSSWIVAGYVLIGLSATVRVFGPWFPSLGLTRIWITAGMLWIGAFTLFLGVYVPILIAPRVDGKSG